jgi:hypothetical protein
MKDGQCDYAIMGDSKTEDWTLRLFVFAMFLAVLPLSLEAQRPTAATSADAGDAVSESKIAAYLEGSGRLITVTTYDVTTVKQKTGPGIEIKGLIASSIGDGPALKAVRFRSGAEVSSVDLQDTAKLSRALQRMIDTMAIWKATPPAELSEMVYRCNPRLVIGVTGSKSGVTAYVVVGASDAEPGSYLDDGTLGDVKKGLDAAVTTIATK